MTTPMQSITTDVQEIQRGLAVLIEPGAVAEVRMLNTSHGTISGYFDNLETMAQTAARWSGTVPAIYVTLNRVNPALLSRAANRVQKFAKHTTSDNDILRRCWFGIDLDPVRPSGIPSTDEEHQFALHRAEQIGEWLSTEGWPQPILADSGNGSHLLYRVDLPNDDASRTLLERGLKALDFRFSDARVVVDLKTANAARIWKVYGTLTCKGDHTASRPHRLARVLKIPEQVSVVPHELLEQLARSVPEEPRRTHTGDGREAFDLSQWIVTHNLPVTGFGPWNGGSKWILNPCPFNPDHTNRAAYIVQHPSGAVAAGCHHNSCVGKDWHTLRDLIEPGWRKTKNGGKQKPRESRPVLADMREGAEASPHPYSVVDGRICRERNTHEGPVTEPLCNFTAAVTDEIVLDDGVETARAFLIRGRLDTGEELPPVRVPTSRFVGMSWVADNWGVRAVVRAGTTVRDQIREAIQRFSPQAKQQRVFTHTGWREIGGAWVYLTSSGAVGHEGFEVDLGSEDLARYQLPHTPEDPVGAMRTSLRLLEIAPLTVTAPLWAAVYRAPLAAALALDLSAWVQGVTGSLKSTLVALYLCHFGSFDRLHLPGAWKSTANMLERRAFTLKDTLFVVDDYAPTAIDVRELDTAASRLLRSQGNLAGRGRLRADLTERPSYPPRGLVLSTGEQHPPGQSLLARMLLIEMDRESVNMAALTKAQNEAHRLPHAMAGYIAWLAPQMPKLSPLLRQTFEGARARATTDDAHLRIPEVLAHLWIGLHSGLTYAEEIGACSTVEAEGYRIRCWDALIAVGRAQGRLVEEERPTRRFLQVLYTLVTQRRVMLLPRDEGVPGPRGDMPLIGWHDEEAIYLMPEASFKEVARFCRESGEPFPVRETRLKRDLSRENISECNPGRYTIIVKVGGQTRRVLGLRRPAVDSLLGVDFEIPLPVVTTVTGSER